MPSPLAAQFFTSSSGTAVRVWLKAFEPAAVLADIKGAADDVHG